MRAGAQPNINAKEYGSLPVPTPSTEEQQAIETVLDDAATEVSLFSRKVEILRTEKKALMQQLLTGKRRVVV